MPGPSGLALSRPARQDAMRRGPYFVLIGLLAATVASAAAGSTTTVAQTAGTVGIRIVDAPESRADDPRARIYVVDHLGPGTTIERRIEVSNDTGEPQSIELYAGSASIEGGEFRFGEGRKPNELTGWTRVAPPSLTLQPAEKGRATVTIAVPRDATEGERYGVVWAEVRAAATPEASIGAVNRVGVRMYLSVGTGGEPETDFEVTDIEGRRDEDGNPTVAAIVRNIGGRAVDLSGDLRLTDGPGGLSAGPISAKGGTTVSPGQSGPVLFILDKALPNGPWAAEISMRSGTTVRQARGTVTFPDDIGAVSKGEVSEGSQRPARSNLLQITAATALLLLIAGVIVLYSLRHLKAKRARPAPAPAPDRSL